MDGYTYMLKRVAFDGNDIESKRDIYFYQNKVEVCKIRISLDEGDFSRKVVENIIDVINKNNNGEFLTVEIKTQRGGNLRKFKIDDDALVVSFCCLEFDINTRYVIKCNSVLLELMYDILNEHKEEEQRMRDRDDVL